jgi:hypothetical protein
LALSVPGSRNQRRKGAQTIDQELAVKKPAKSTAKKSTATAAKRSRGLVGNLQLLIKEGVVIEPDRLSDGEKQIINDLTPAEVEALRSVHSKFSSRPEGRKSPLWRAFCF